MYHYTIGSYSRDTVSGQSVMESSGYLFITANTIVLLCHTGRSLPTKSGQRLCAVIAQLLTYETKAFGSPVKGCTLHLASLTDMELNKDEQDTVIIDTVYNAKST